MKKKSRWRFLLPFLCLAAVGGAGAFFYFRGDETPQYIIVPVQRGNIESTVLASGTVESNNMVSVGAQVSGQVKSLKVELGDVVKTGQLVAEIDSLPQKNTLNTRIAALDAVHAQKQAKKASLQQAELAFKRQQKMLKSDASSREDYEVAEANLKVIQAEIVSLDAQIEQARIAVDTAQIDLGYTQISSPIDGVVVAIVTKEGQTVNANQTTPTIIKVAQLDRMQIKVEISEADVIRVKPGQKAYFTILGAPDLRFPATLKSIEPAPESIITSDTISSSSGEAIYYMGVLEVPNEDGKLRISMTTEVHIILQEALNALVIPSAALGEQDKEKGYKIKISTGADTYSERWVRIGLNNNVQAEVLDGLEEGEKIVIGEQLVTNTESRRPSGPPGRMPRI